MMSKPSWKLFFNNFWTVIGFFLLLSLIVIQSPTLAVVLPDDNPTQQPRFNKERVIAKFRRDVSQVTINSVLNQAGVRILATYESSGVSVLRVVRSKPSIPEIIDILLKSGTVVYAEPDFLQSIDAVFPNDPSFSELWGLHNTGQAGGTPDADVDAPEAWERGTEGTAVIGVIDTGIDYTHADLATNMWVNPGETEGNGIDDDGNGYVDDIYGIDCANDDSDPFDDHYHGTHVAGTIGAVGDNGVGVVGLNWDTQLMALKFLDSGGSGWTSDAIECLDYTIQLKNDYGVNILLTSNSWGGGGFSQSLKDTIQASGEADMLFVAAAGNAYGNDNDQFPHYPSSYDLPNIIAVAAMDRNDELASFSSIGLTSVDLGAPGEDIFSTFPANDYGSISGTSMATPHVSGAASLLDAGPFGLSSLEIKETLLFTADLLDSLSVKTVSGGRLNTDNAVHCDPDITELVFSLQDGFVADGRGPNEITAKLFACRFLKDALVIANFSNGDPELILRDDGAAPDRSADDGIYTANWRPLRSGSVTVDLEADVDGELLQASIDGKVAGFDGYVFEDAAPFDWIDISNTGEPLNLSDDDYARIDIPLPVTIYDQSHGQITIGSNGHIYFTGEFSEYFNGPIPTNAFTNALIAPFWDDLNPAVGGEIYWEIRGEAPERRLIVQYEGIPHYTNPGDASFQVIFYENSNQVLMQYRDVDFGTSELDNGASATVGIQKDSDSGQQYSLNQPVLQDGMAIFGQTLMEVTSVSTGEPYAITRAEIDAPIYIDRGYTITELSDNLQGGVLIRTANDDKSVDAAEHLKIRLWRDAALYVAYDIRGAATPPSWLNDGTWIETGEVLSSNDNPMLPMVVFRKDVAAGENIILGGNHQGGNTGARSNYLVIGVERPLVEIVSVSTGKPYAFGRAELDEPVYIDRGFTITDLTSGLEGGVLVRTANNDKFVDVDEHLVLRMTNDAALYVAYDMRGADTPPLWLSDDTWIETGEALSSTDNFTSPMVVFRKDVAAGENVILGGNHQGGNTGARSNYLVIAQPLVEIVSVSTGKPYALGRAELDAHVYIDRNFTITDLTPDLEDGVLIKTANNDKFIDVSEHIVLRFRQGTTVYVGYDKRGGAPLWLEDWTLEPGEFITTSDRTASPMDVFSKAVTAGDILVLGGNHEGGDTGARSHYIVITKP